ncbi:hypothetical protein NDN08_004154 [Rhodosorus marinus]|uniref:Uncharacterized protein n=1 Tax=Rhodosorus marinus TaxID=101924 RepID=A0AAV8UKX8_9RHOD|nr:hypothetical protein NDN08_004154 [Rhodosorus marinus]
MECGFVGGGGLWKSGRTGSLWKDKKNPARIRVAMNAKVAFAFGGGSELGSAYSAVFKEAGYEVSFANRMISESFKDPRPFDVMFNTTIGFTAEGLGSDELFESVDFMMHTNVDASLVTAKLACQFIKPGGLLFFLGSVAAFSQTHTIGYSIAKAALHQIVRTVALSVGTELPEGVRVIGIVPVVLDTTIHRNMNNGKAEPDWTPPSIITSKLLSWAEGHSEVPENGSLVAVTSADVQINPEKTARQHLFRYIETPSFIQTRLL